MQRRHAMPFGAELGPDGVRFALWAPSASTVDLLLGDRVIPMDAEEAGWRRLRVPDAKSGDLYAFRIDGDLVVPDPASRFQPDDVTGRSQVVDPSAFAWTDAGWHGRPWEDTVLYEVHVGTATPDGTFAALADDLERLRDLGVTAVELMPLNDFVGGRNWGYDGVLPFAPDSSYGTPDDLKRLVARAHALGLTVFVDVVYNHFGPSGNYLPVYAKPFFTDRHKTPWGDAVNFDGADAGPVREFFIHNAIYWIEEFGVDGLRFDAVHAIIDDSEPNILAEIATRVREAASDRQVHLVLENDRNGARWLHRDPTGRAILHDAQWNDDIHHCWHTLLTGETDAYYADYADDPVGRLGRCLAEGFAYQGEVSGHSGEPRGESTAGLPPSAFVAFIQNHDQVGNRAFGERVQELTSPDKMTLARAGLLLSPQIPLIFMGGEWGASTPFQFFVDFSSDPDLASAVRDGRRREFGKFEAFSDPHILSQIPDPTETNTFLCSKLNRAEATEPEHAAVLAEVGHLLALRRDVVVPLARTQFLRAEFRQSAPGALDVSWRFGGGTLRFAAHFGEGEVRVEPPGAGRAIWNTSGLDVASGRLRPWTGFFALIGSDDER